MSLWLRLEIRYSFEWTHIDTRKCIQPSVEMIQRHQRAKLKQKEQQAPWGVGFLEVS